jgi:hypothetical protein
MIERKVMDRSVLIDTLNRMHYQYISELQMHHLFLKFGTNIQIEEDEEVDLKEDEEEECEN